MHEEDVRADQRRRARLEFENTVRVMRASNGFVVKRPDGQYIFNTMPEMLKAVESFFTMTQPPKPGSVIPQQ